MKPRKLRLILALGAAILTALAVDTGFNSGFYGTIWHFSAEDILGWLLVGVILGSVLAILLVLLHVLLAGKYPKAFWLLAMVLSLVNLAIVFSFCRYLGGTASV